MRLLHGRAKDKRSTAAASLDCTMAYTAHVTIQAPRCVPFGGNHSYHFERGVNAGSNGVSRVVAYSANPIKLVISSFLRFSLS